MSIPKYCAILPAYNEEAHIAKTVRGVLKEEVDAIVMDDGSTDKTVEAAKSVGAKVLSQEKNLGKGAALNAGIEYALSCDYEAILTLDADGQHNPAEISSFIKLYEERNVDVIVGNRMAKNANMPLIRRWTNQFMSWLLSRMLKQKVPDTQNGYRMYRCSILRNLTVKSMGYAAESEILLLLSEQGCKISSVPTATIYGDEKSKIHPLRDTIRFFKMLHKYRHLKSKEEE